MMKNANLLIVDDNKNILISLKYLLGDLFSRVVMLSSPQGIPEALRKERFDCALLDMNFTAGINSGNEGLFWLREIKKLSPATEVVLFTAYADIDLAVKGMKEGAADFVVKPWDNEKLVATLTKAAECCAAGKRAAAKDGGRTTPKTAMTDASMYWGGSGVMEALRKTVEKVSATDANILITGENGTGKDVLAREIHRLSRRRGKELVSVDMGAISESLFESELFGHVKGSFTDAHTDRAGRFEAADGSTLFLDEIANLPYHLQAKLLTAIQTRSFTRVGSNQVMRTDIRLICATNRNLEEMVKQGEFREDLFYRINTIHLHLPALRERMDEVMPLANIFLKRYAAMYGREVKGFSDEAEKKLLSHPWRGNIRELQHAVEKAVILSESGTLRAEELQLAPAECGTAECGVAKEEVRTLDEMEGTLIRQAVEESGGNLSKAASLLGVTRQTLYNKMKKHGI